MNEKTLWEYRVLTIGHIWGTNDGDIEQTLNEWGTEGWEAIMVYTPEGSGKVTMVAKRPLTEDEIRRRTRTTRMSAGG
jgi:hypothetical protein